MRIPKWQQKSDDDLRAIARGVWEGRVVGTWQVRDAREQKRIFPGYEEFEMAKGLEQAGATTVFSNPVSAQAYARVPFPAQAYAHLPDAAPEPPAVRPSELPVLADWEVFSWDEWKRVRELLGYPSPKPAPSPAG